MRVTATAATVSASRSPRERGAGCRRQEEGGGRWHLGRIPTSVDWKPHNEEVGRAMEELNMIFNSKRLSPRTDTMLMVKGSVTL